MLDVSYYDINISYHVNTLVMIYTYDIYKKNEVKAESAYLPGGWFYLMVGRDYGIGEERRNIRRRDRDRDSFSTHVSYFS